MEDYLKQRKMAAVVNDEETEWREVNCGVPQGSVLVSIMFLVYVNYMTKQVSSYISLLADNAKLLRKIRNHEDCELQNYI